MWFMNQQKGADIKDNWFTLYAGCIKKGLVDIEWHTNNATNSSQLSDSQIEFI